MSVLCRNNIKDIMNLLTIRESFAKLNSLNRKINILVNKIYYVY